MSKLTVEDTLSNLVFIHADNMAELWKLCCHQD